MSLLERRPVLRWVVPVLAALLLAAGGTAVTMISATARAGLPDRTAAQLLVDVQRAKVDGFSGTVVQNADLGLPSLPGVGGGSGGSSDLTSMVSGSHTLRLWYAGPRRVRMALLGSLGESDVVRRGSDLWTWSSTDKSATHRTIPASAGQDGPRSLAEASPLTPQQAAEAALRAITPSTRVSTAGTAVVAGRSAYELVLRPRDSASLVTSARIAIDGRTHVPTRVQVFGADTGKPALEVGFTSFDPTRPGATVFRFNPPPGTDVSREGTKGLGREARARHERLAGQADKPRFVGTGWTTVAVTKVPAATGTSARTLATLTQALPAVSGSWGSGHLLRGTLFSAVLTKDGRVAVGAVAPAALYDALGRG